MTHTVSEGIGAKAKDRKIVSKGGPVRARAATEFRSHKNKKRSALSRQIPDTKNGSSLSLPHQRSPKHAYYHGRADTCRMRRFSPIFDDNDVAATAQQAGSKTRLHAKPNRMTKCTAPICFIRKHATNINSCSVHGAQAKRLAHVDGAILRNVYRKR